ncbi:MAG: hypothetical protein HKL90_04600 [Elusimicrobia bacterium]|nr:hypothetical protein [Elusimicrobiota bacterium]
MRHARIGILTILTAVAPLCASAAALKREEVPAPLQGWIGWVLHGHEAETCTFYQGKWTRNCSWPGALQLALDEASGRFEQTWRLEVEDWVPLPGSEERWPQDVRVDGIPVAVISRGGVPSVLLKAGVRKVVGTFRWSHLPEQLEIPSVTGLLALTLRGRPSPFPLRDDAGRLWLQVQARPAAPREDSRLEITVHRRLIDDMPLQLITRIQLKISGANREVVLGRPLPEGFTPMSLVTPLPARLDADGRLRVQARSGTWNVTLVARREKVGDEIRLPAPGGPWAADEAWVFDARPDLRQVDIEGAPSLDPRQTELPADWKNFPAYLVRPATSLSLHQRRRGDDPPAPDRLTIQRELWLDFDGRGFSARDHIQGTLGRSWRLESSPETRLGRASAFGVDQFLTVLSSGGPAGLEIRTRQVDVTADSRIEGRALTASGWRHDFESVAAVVNLPPGWRLLHVSGADKASPTWIGDWTLYDFFLVLVAAAAFTKLYGRAWGAAAVAGLALLWHEPGAPTWLWPAALACAALDRGLTEHPSFSRYIVWARRAVGVCLVVVCVPFFISQIRCGLYPALEEPGQSVQPRTDEDMAPHPAEMASFRKLFDGGSDRAPHGQRGDQYALKAAASAQLMGSAMNREASAGGSLSMAGSESIPAPAMPNATAPDSSFYNAVLMQMRLDPQARVTTGPGLPYWSWHRASIFWSGPVGRGQRVRLWLISPSANFCLALARIVLATLLALVVVGLPVDEWLAALRDPAARARALRALLPLLLIVAAGARTAVAADFPPKELLDELRAELLEKSACAPNCADSPHLQLRATASWLSLRFDVHAAAPTAVPLPGGGREWNPVKGTLDGFPAHAVRGGDGALWVPVSAGTHSLVLEGPLPERDAVQIALPMKPRRIDSAVSGWTLNGVREDGRVEDNLQLSRIRGAEPAKRAAAAARAQGIFPPFLRVTRILRLGLSWSVETRVARLTPLGSPVVLQIPLLPGESVTSSDVRVVGGKVQLSLPPQSVSASWTSVMPETANLKLSAPESVPWSESWQVEPGPLWHLQATGVPPVYQEAGEGARSLNFRPWPGESLELAISRPGAVVGQTLTVDQSALTLSPGVRATEASLALSIRTSRGDRQVLTLPEGAELISTAVDNAQQPLRLDGRRLSIAVTPGAHSIAVNWRQPGGSRAFFRAPKVDIGASGVNTHLQISMPEGRWTLLLGGPGLGPVVLFWSMLAVFLLVSVGLSKTKLSPLSAGQWLLLSVGLTQLSAPAAALVAGWFITIGARGARKLSPRAFNTVQVLLACYTIIAAALLLEAVHRGLLGTPDMQIAGNGSSADFLRWYVDRSGTALPRPWILSVPLGVYRAAMLAWALWLANSLIEWARWAWAQCGFGGLWNG